MIAAFDNTVLSLALQPGQNPPEDSTTGLPLDRARERVEALIDSFGARGDVLIVPTPVLAEVLFAVPDLQRALDQLNRSSAIDFAGFDERAAIELALIERQAVADGVYKASGTPKQKAKFDRQIAVIAKVNGAEKFYTDDERLTLFAKRIGLVVVQTSELPLPPPVQVKMNLPDGTSFEKVDHNLEADRARENRPERPGGQDDE